MKKLKHFIITRFFPFAFEHQIYDITDRGFLLSQFDIFKKNILNSLLNQTCYDFELVIMINNKIDDSKVDFLNDIDVNGKFKVIVLHERDVKKYIDEAYEKYDYVITSRYDFDDFIKKTCVNDIQQLVDDNVCITVCGYKNGYIYFDYDNTLYECVYDCGMTDGMPSGFHSIMLSVIVNTDKCNTKDIWAYCSGHGVIGKYIFNELCKKLNLDKKNIVTKFISESPGYIYFRSKTSSSYILAANNSKTIEKPKYAKNKVDKTIWHTLQTEYNFKYELI